jgi:hypothetical protein
MLYMLLSPLAPYKNILRDTHMYLFKIQNSPNTNIFSSYILFEQTLFIMTRSYQKFCKITTVNVFPNYVLSAQELHLQATVTCPLSDKH